jgi:hypothetical protein
MISVEDLLEEAFGEVATPIRFHHQPDPIPGDLRLGWRLPVLMLVLDQCRGKTANLEQVHLLLWSLRSEAGRELIVRWFAGDRRPDDPIVRYDPSLTRTIALAIAAGLVNRNNNQTLTLGAQGRDIASVVKTQEGVLVEEKRTLQDLPKGITQAKVRQLLEWQ